MLTEEETLAFLSMLTTFMTNAGLSMNSTAKVFGVSVATLSRWYSNKKDRRHTPARWVAYPIVQKIEALNSVADYSGLISKSQAKRIIELRGMLPAIKKSQRRTARPVL